MIWRLIILIEEYISPQSVAGPQEKRGMCEAGKNLILKLRIDDYKEDFELIEGKIRDECIPITMSGSVEGLEKGLKNGLKKGISEGIQPSVTMMNQEYLRLKLNVTKWLRSKDFLIDSTIPLHNGLYLKAYTIFDSDFRELFIELRRDNLCFDEETSKKLKKRSRSENDIDLIDAFPNRCDGI